MQGRVCADDAMRDGEIGETRTLAPLASLGCSRILVNEVAWLTADQLSQRSRESNRKSSRSPLSTETVWERHFATEGEIAGQDD